jgi:hypothetical protein
MAMPRALLRPVKSAESLVTASGAVQRSQSERRTSRGDLVPDERTISMESNDDLLGPLEAVSKAVANSHMMRDSPKTHSRSSSHESYFERKLLLKLEAGDSDAKMDSSLDLSEIQVNFDLEENEMKIFSEDEAMMSNSLDDGCSDDFTRSPLEEAPAAATTSIITRTSDFYLKKTSPKPLQKVVQEQQQQQHNEASNEASPKTRKMSFREKFKRFTSPTPNRKNTLETGLGDESSSDGGRGDTPPREPKNNNKSEPHKSLREKLVCALSPESLRKRDSSAHLETTTTTTTTSNKFEASPKKKKSSFSPGTSPNNTSQLVKRSKIGDDTQNDEDTVLEEKAIKQELPLSPSINFIDASMTESFESFIANKSSIINVADNNKTVPEVVNPRFSTTSSTEGDDQQQVDQLVIAQVHHNPIPENRIAEEQESGKLIYFVEEKNIRFFIEIIFSQKF